MSINRLKDKQKTSYMFLCLSLSHTQEYHSSMVAQVYDPGTCKERESEAQDHPQLHSQFKASMDYMRNCQSHTCVQSIE